MQLSELVTYANKKYQIQEVHKWKECPNFSILADTISGQWIALLMRQWDPETGMEIQVCDLKCGQQILRQLHTNFLREPFRMKGKKWIGIIFDRRTNAAIVYRLFDQAVSSLHQRGYTIVLDDSRPNGVYRDTNIASPHKIYHQTEIKIPKRIKEMMNLYVHGHNSFQEKCHNFYRQGKYMENYVDDIWWKGNMHFYYTTYYDLNIRQLRGYFTWRTYWRMGSYRSTCISFGYMYLYEILCGIGVHSSQEGFQKLQEFQTHFIDAGYGNQLMEINLHKWMKNYVIVHDMPKEIFYSLCDAYTLQKEKDLAALKDPDAYSDEEVFAALSHYYGRLMEKTAAYIDEDKGHHLFAECWRSVLQQFQVENIDFFSLCFGNAQSIPWHPFQNAIYWQEGKPDDQVYDLSSCHLYCYKDGKWIEKRYETIYLNRYRFAGLLHEACRIFRKTFKTGHYLKKQDSEAWASQYIEYFLKSEKQKAIEASKPHIQIDFSSLHKIRQDASITRDSLLTEEEMEEEEPKAEAKEAVSDEIQENELLGLDASSAYILQLLLKDRQVDAYIQEKHLMPSIVADTINNALFDEIGDNVLECDGKTLMLIEDYKEDIREVLEG